MDKAIEGMDGAVGAVVSGGERRSSPLSTARDDAAVAALAPGRRGSLSREREVVLRRLQGEPVEGLSRRLGLPVWKLEEWRQRGLAAIRRDLARSPWTGEGHRKVRARLRVRGENHLLSPHRRPPRPADGHDGSITTEAPNVLWGADGAVIPTVKDGNVTLFIVAEHWNAEGLGRHVARHGNRYAAAEALALAVSRVFGSAGADAARGVSVRHDHGSPFLSGYFQSRPRFFGMAPSFAFVREPGTNGAAERFLRTLKEQIVFGRVYQDIEEVRTAARAYFDRYNQHRLLEKNSYRSPAAARRYWMAARTTTHEAA